MYIVSRHNIISNEIEIIHYEEDTEDINYNNCFNIIMDEIKNYQDENITTKIINKNFMSVYCNGYLYGKYHMYNYEIHNYT